MKRYLSIILILLMVFSFAACKKTPVDTETTTEVPTDNAPTDLVELPEEPESDVIFDDEYLTTDAWVDQELGLRFASNEKYQLLDKAKASANGVESLLSAMSSHKMTAYSKDTDSTINVSVLKSPANEAESFDADEGIEMLNQILKAAGCKNIETQKTTVAEQEGARVDTSIKKNGAEYVMTIIAAPFNSKIVMFTIIYPQDSQVLNDVLSLFAKV